MIYYNEFYENTGNCPMAEFVECLGCQICEVEKYFEEKEKEYKQLREEQHKTLWTPTITVAINVNKIIQCKTKNRNNYAHYCDLLKKYDNRNYQNIKKLLPTSKDTNTFIDDYTYQRKDIQEIEENPDDENWVQFIKGDTIYWQII